MLQALNLLLMGVLRYPVIKNTLFRRFESIFTGHGLDLYIKLEGPANIHTYRAVAGIDPF